MISLRNQINKYWNLRFDHSQITWRFESFWTQKTFEAIFDLKSINEQNCEHPELQLPLTTFSRKEVVQISES